jgi:hypothetical protein
VFRCFAVNRGIKTGFLKIDTALDILLTCMGGNFKVLTGDWFMILFQ